jgi:DNA-binding LytR/AlgR family response regulator
VNLRILVVDDEPLAVRRLQLVLAAIDDVEVVGTAGGCGAAVQAIEVLKPDVVLLDIRMRDGSGLDVAARLTSDLAPVVVFVTAYDTYATAAFDQAAADYVLKPVDLARLRQALERARRVIETRAAADRIAELQSIIAAIREARGVEASDRTPSELWIRRNATDFIRLPVATIEWVEAEGGGYVRLHAGGRSYLQRGSIAGFEARVDPGAFVRVHRATLVRKEAVVEVKRGALGFPEVVLSNGVRLRVGRIYAKRLRRLFAGREPVPGGEARAA